MSKFHHNFWSDNGISVLYSQVLKSNSILSDFISLLECRVAAEDYYAMKLDAVANITLKSSDQSLIGYQAEMARLKNTQQSKSEQLKGIISHLKSCLKDFAPLKQEVDSLAKTLEKLRIEIDASHHSTTAKYKKAEEALSQEPVEAIDSLDLMINMGSLNMTVEEFNNTCFFLQQEAKIEDVKGFLTVTKDCSVIDSVVELISKHLEIHQEASSLFLNDLISRGFLSKVSNTHVKWKKMFMDNEKASKIAKREADVADLDYKRLVRLGQNTTLLFEKKSLEFMAKVEQEIKDRVVLIKNAFEMIMKVDSPDSNAMDQSKKRLNVFLEMMDPEKEISMIIEQFRTGTTRMKPIIYFNYYDGPETIFGVPLEQIIRKYNRKVPLIVTKTLEAISEYFSSQIGVSSQIDSWINYDLDHEDIHALINLCNTGSIQKHVLKTYSISALIGFFARYLIDLPNSVCSNEIYDPLKILYLSSKFDLTKHSEADDHGAMRLNSLRSVLTSMPSSHFHVLLYIMKHWYSMVQSSKPDEFKVNELSVALGPLILRPEHESKLTLHDKHPSRLVKDLLIHFEDIFSLDVLSTQTSMDDLEASLRESLDGSPVIESQQFNDDAVDRKFSLDSAPENASIIEKSLLEGLKQEPTPIEKEVAAFSIGEE